MIRADGRSGCRAGQAFADLSRRAVQNRGTDVFEKEVIAAPLTVADFASQAAICRLIGDAFPRDPIIGEEESGALRREENGPFLEAA